LVSEEMRAVKLKVCHNVRPEEVRIYMSAADVLLVTSSHEAGPLAALEAVSCNLPVVTVDVGFVRKHIGNIQGCIVCDDDEPRTIANGIRQVLRTSSRLENGKTQIGHMCDRAAAKKVVALYEKVLVSWQ
jgi:teichuronic acid biosynthesis glycosyltransferase TuaC